MICNRQLNYFIIVIVLTYLSNLEFKFEQAKRPLYFTDSVNVSLLLIIVADAIWNT